MSELEVRELRYFVAVAEELNFSRAAERLGMAQPPLSKAIQGLEKRLGVELLTRTTRHVALTDAGEVLLEQGRYALEAVAAAAEHTVRAGRAETRLMVAHKPGGDGGLMPAIAQRYAAADGRPRIEIVVGGWAEQSVMVRSGRADVAVVRDLFDRRGLDVEPLLTEPRCAVLARGHRLADAPVLTRADLSGEPVPVWPQATARHTAFRAGVDHLPEGMVRFGGVVPVTGSGEIGGSLAADGTAADPAAPIHIPDGPEVHDFAQLAEVVALGLGVAFLPASAAELYPRSDLVYVPVRDVTPSNVLVVWPSHSTSRAVAAFVQAALDAAASVRVDSVRENSARSD